MVILLTKCSNCHERLAAKIYISLEIINYLFSISDALVDKYRSRTVVGVVWATKSDCGLICEEE